MCISAFSLFNSGCLSKQINQKDDIGWNHSPTEGRNKVALKSMGIAKQRPVEPVLCCLLLWAGDNCCECLPTSFTAAGANCSHCKNPPPFSSTIQLPVLNIYNINIHFLVYLWRASFDRWRKWKQRVVSSCAHSHPLSEPSSSLAPNHIFTKQRSFRFTWRHETLCSVYRLCAGSWEPHTPFSLGHCVLPLGKKDPVVG